MVLAGMTPIKLIIDDRKDNFGRTKEEKEKRR